MKLKFIKQYKNKIIAFILIFSFPNISQAETLDFIKNIFGEGINIIGTFLGGAIAWIIFVIGYIISVIAGAVIALEATLIEIVLQLNSQVIQSEFVQSGFLISLSITNLIFVGGIIIIAIATILRRETYGIKQALWKLIVMAVLVNFSLTISGAIINISDNFSNYFLDAINPEVGAGGVQTQSKYGAFATAIAGSFNAQRFFLNNKPGFSQSDGENLAGLAGASLANLIKPIISLFFVIIFLIQIIVAMESLVIMLLTRYIALGILLIVAPLAWAMWVFPYTQKYWTEWWDRFNKWNIFAPVVLFFLYLCILTLRGTSGGMTAVGNQYSVGGVSFVFNPQRSDAIGAVNSFVSSFLGDITKTILEMIMMIGCITGGLMAANKLGVEGAKTFSNVATGINNGAKNWIKNKSSNLAKRGLDRAGGYAASTMTEPPPTYTGWRRIFNPINKLTYKVGGIASKVIPEDKKEKLLSIAQKQGPVTREQERQEKRSKINQYKKQLEEINNKLKEAPKLIAEKQKEVKTLIETISLLENKYIESKQKGANKGQLEEIGNQIDNKKAELRIAKSYTENFMDQIKKEKEQLEQQLKELNPSLLTSIIKKTYQNMESFTQSAISEGYESFKKGPKPEKTVKISDLQKSGISRDDAVKIGEVLGMKIKIEDEKTSAGPPKPKPEQETGPKSL